MTTRTITSHSMLIPLTQLSACLVVLGFRIALGITLRPWYAFDQGADDRLLVDQASGAAGLGYGYTLSKNQGYAMLLRTAHVLGIDVVTLSLLTLIAAAGLAALAAWAASRRLWPAVLAWIGVLCWPASMDDWLGLRVYRNTVFFPAMTALAALCVLLIVCTWRLGCDRERPHAGWTVGATLSAIAAGGLAAWLQTLKEDMVWLIPGLLIVLMVTGLAAARHGLAKSIRLTVSVVCILSVSIGALGMVVAKQYMQSRYGISYLNMRTEGPVAGFIERMTVIDASGRTDDVWAPPQAIQQAFDAADALDRYPEIEQWMLSEHGYDQPLKGDFVGWQLFNAISNSNLGWDDPAEVADLFDRANDQIDQAFEAGKLKRAAGFKPISALPAIDAGEMPDLIRRASLDWLHAWIPGNLFTPSKPATDGYFQSLPMPLGRFYGMEYLGIDPGNPLPQPLPWLTHDQARDWSMVLNRIWTPVALIMLIVLLAAPVVTVARRRRTGWLPVMLAFAAWMIAAYGWAYCMATAWFAGWLHSSRIEFFYTAGLVAPLIGTACLVALCALIASMRNQHA